MGLLSIGIASALSTLLSLWTMTSSTTINVNITYLCCTAKVCKDTESSELTAKRYVRVRCNIAPENSRSLKFDNSGFENE